MVMTVWSATFALPTDMMHTCSVIHCWSARPHKQLLLLLLNQRNEAVYATAILRCPKHELCRPVLSNFFASVVNASR